MGMLVKLLKPEDITPLKELFKQLDQDKTGFIHVQELSDALEASGHHLSKSEIENIVKEIDAAKNGKINYTEFLAATFDLSSLVTEQKLWMIFKRFDVDNTEYISKENLIQAMRKLGKRITMEEVEEAMNEHDINLSGNINFEEFLQMFDFGKIRVPNNCLESPLPPVEPLSSVQPREQIVLKINKVQKILSPN